MKSNTPLTMLVVLLAIASLATTLLLAMTVIGRGAGATTAPVQLTGGSLQPSAAGERVPVLFELSPFSLTEGSGQPFGSDELRGRVWVANFIFSTCSGPCPMITSRMAKLQFELQNHPRWPEIRLVSITVDPEHDTPEMLREYARLAHADPQRWFFLTGPRDQVRQVIRQGFKLPVENDADNPQMPILHSQKFVLVDRQHRVRGYYEAIADQDRQRLREDIERVLSEAVEP